jgi:hypothetical protein
MMAKEWRGKAGAGDDLCEVQLTKAQATYQYEEGEKGIS